MKNGLESSQLFSDTIGNDCPNCGAEDTLHYHTKELEVDETTSETLLVEGLVCSQCDDIFMSPDEGARFLNVKARYDGSEYYYGSHDGEIIETRLQ